MALNNSGPISLAGTGPAASSIAAELGLGATTCISMNQAAVRGLAGKPSGAIVMPTDFYGKSNAYPIEFLVIAGGAGGSFGGGGAGGYIERSCSPSYLYSAGQPALCVIVGGGGGGGRVYPGFGQNGGDGGCSCAGGMQAFGGGGGATYGGNGLNGGSGGGNGRDNNSGSAGNSTQTNNGGGTGYGNPGGWNLAGGQGVGGGGGAGGKGSNAPGPGGPGGAGRASSITGSPVLRAGGGGGGGKGESGQPGGSGGPGGGAAGAPIGSVNTAATANCGAGGGGRGWPGGGIPAPVHPFDATGGPGSSGSVYLRMPTANYSGQTTGSPQVTTSGSDTILRYNSSGSYTP